MSDDYMARIAAEQHAKLLETREQLARATAALNARLTGARGELLTAAEAAERFIRDDTCRHDSEKVAVLFLLKNAISRAGGGG